MSHIAKWGMMMGIIALLSGCTDVDVKKYANEEPKMDVQEFFNGPIKAWGVVQDRSGEVTLRFTIDMKGSWKGDVGTLYEKFYFSDGTTTERTWTINKTASNTFEGHANDVLGSAKGEVVGNAVNWHYVMKLPLSNPKYEIKMNDWMWRMGENEVLNRVYMTKFGITVSEMTIFMQKL